ncbi:acetyl-CoA carboxylase [Levilactobacillus brevis]|uniref:acetyl-CoA carboxylase n=1 Tax=Levilactobacillus brevis TaxID=1580 RepID=UPI0021A47968|nr:acetyl-CoA carboxylase [Levilactobacillus brevis]MCT3599301.1 acetyl-CoA carboxylase [Levilactobacillus brevis]
MMQIENDAKVINERIDASFKRLINTRYQINVVFNHYSKTFNFLMYVAHPKKRSRSIPLHTVDTDDLVYLESLIKRIQAHTQLTITYTGFVGEKWPSDLRPIQKTSAVGDDTQYLKEKNHGN